MEPTPPVFVIGDGRDEMLPVSPRVVGNKAANLSRLANLGLRVPPAIVLGTNVCEEYFERGGTFGPDFPQWLAEYIRRLEAATGLRLGGRRPLLLSVRSSPPISMPGMLDTILNCGLTESTVRGLIRATGNATLAWDTYRRFVRGFAETVWEVPPALFDRLSDRHLKEAHVGGVTELDPLALRALGRESAEQLNQVARRTVPSDPLAQVICAVEAVCRSWNSPRAREYRRLHQLDALTATAVVIQAMVFGNAGSTSGSGVAFTRDPADGGNRLYLDFLFNAQGEDVVSGRQPNTDAHRLAAVLPAVMTELEEAKRRLEREFRDMQDVEFTVQEGVLYFLQTRSAKRTPWAALQVLVDFVDEGILEADEALERAASMDVQAIQRTRANPGHAAPIATGIPAGLGVVAGAIALDSASARALASHQSVILVRREMSPDDIEGLAAADGVLTMLGGRTSHAAVVARQLGKTCVVGCRALRVEQGDKVCEIAGQMFREGEPITIDGDTGHIYRGRLPVSIERPLAALERIDSWRHVTQ